MTLDAFRRRLLATAFLAVLLFSSLFSIARAYLVYRRLERNMVQRRHQIEEEIVETLLTYGRFLGGQALDDASQRLFPGISEALLAALVVTDEGGQIVESLRGPLARGMTLPGRFLALSPTVTSLFSVDGTPLLSLARPLHQGGWIVAALSPDRFFRRFSLLREGEWALILSATGQVLVSRGSAGAFPFGASLPSRVLSLPGSVADWAGRRHRFLLCPLPGERLFLAVGYPMAKIWIDALEGGLAAGSALSLGCLLMMALLFLPFASILRALSAFAAELAALRRAVADAANPSEALTLLGASRTAIADGLPYAEFRSIESSFDDLLRTVALQGEELTGLYEEATIMEEELSDSNRRLNRVMDRLNALLTLTAASQAAGDLDGAASALADGICALFDSPFCALVAAERRGPLVWRRSGLEELARAFSALLDELDGGEERRSVEGWMGSRLHLFPVRTLGHLVGGIAVALPPGGDDESLEGVMEPLLPHLAGLLHSREMVVALRGAYHDVSLRMQVFTQAYHEETGAHLARIGDYAVLFGAELGLPDDYLSDLRAFSQLHDVGKLRVPQAILAKPSALTAEEFAVVKRHTLWGAEILGDSPWFSMARDICLGHHERWCGGGYPRGLSGEAIPLAARIVSLCDVYDALRSRRSYKPPFSHERALRIILEGDGRVEPDHFDPRLLEIFRRRGDDLARLFESRPDETPQE